MKNLVKISAVSSIMSIMALTGSANADTLSNIKAKGVLNCGVSTGTAGYSSTNSKGVWSGFDVDVCRATAAAVLGDATKVKFVPLTAKERFTALQSGEIDLLSRTTTWTLTRDASLGLNFAGVNYYDGQGFMVKKSLGVDSLKELAGATFCLKAGTTHELNLADYMRANKMQYKLSLFDNFSQIRKAIESNRCDAVSSDQSQLYSLRTTFKNPNNFVIVDDVISKEPLGPVVRQGDDKWFNIVKWSLNAMITAEELGVNSSNVNEKSNNPEINRLLGNSGKLSNHLGLDKYWAKNIISQVGNYSESFERNLGNKSPLKINRGLNALWNQGGILYSAPFR